MKNSTKLKKRLVLLYRNTAAVIVVWILIVAGSLSWNIYNERQSIQKLAKKEAHSSFKKDEAFRLWIASRGGVYVPLDEKTPSNPYLKHPERDITTKSGKKLTLMNAAYVFGKVMEEHGPLTGVKWRLTSLKPTNPANESDEWERKTLLAFEQDPKEMFGFTDIKGEPYLRLLSPLVTKKFCLTCHAFQGYKVGEIRGAVGVSVPMAPYLSVERKAINTLIWTHGILLLLGLVAIGFVSNNSKKRILGRIRIEEELKKHKDHLEELVKERTVEIERTNESLRHEIIERKQAEEALRESEEEFRVLYNNSPDMYVSVSPDDASILLCNETLLNKTRYSREEIIGSPIFKMYHDDCMAEAKKTFQQFVETGVIRDKELILKRKDGSKIDVSLNTNAVKDETGEIQYSMSSWRDITEAKLAEEALRASEDKFRSFAEQSIVGIYLISEGAFKYVNPKFAEIFGYSTDECLDNMHFPQLVHPEDLATVEKQVGRRLSGETKTVRYSFRGIKKNGETIHVEIFGASMLLKGRTVATGTMLDITDRKQAEEKRKQLQAQLQQAQKMEAMGTLAGGIAHDFNNLLMAIQGRTSIMLMKKDSSHPDFGHLRGIEDNIESAADLTRQLLGFARGGKYEVKPTDLNELIKKQNRMFSRTKKEVTIRGKYEKDLWSVEVDRGQIESR